MESLNADFFFFFFQFFAKIIKSFALSSWLGILNIRELETFQRFSPNLLNFQLPLLTEIEVKLLFAYHVIT